MVRPLDEDARGILAPGAIRGPVVLERFEPSPGTRRFVDRYWTVTWDLRGREPSCQEVLPHPVVNLVVEAGAATVSGVATRRAIQRLEGQGRAVAAMFRPGGFSPLLDGVPVRSLRDRRLPAVDLLGPVVGDAVDEIGGLRDAGAAAAVLDRVLLRRFAERVPAGVTHECELATAAATLAATDRSLTRVDQLARAAGLRVRRLQQLFADHVGLGPKGVLRRYRLYEAAEAVAWGERADWARLAVELGYSDQAHLTRDFTSAYGRSPERYARECAAALDGAAVTPSRPRPSRHRT